MYKHKFSAVLEAERKRRGVEYVSKRTHWSFFIWWMLDQVFKIFGHRGILDHFWTVVGRTIYLPGKDTPKDYPEELLFQVLHHEIQHQHDLNPNWFTYAWRGLKYLLSKKYRAWTERRGYLRSMEAIYIYDGYLSESVKGFFLEMLSGRAYFNMMEEEKAREWISRASTYLELLHAQGKLPLNRDVNVKGITD